MSFLKPRGRFGIYVGSGTMVLRALTLVYVLAVLAACPSMGARAQGINGLKAGVVRIQNNRSEEVGTGFVVKADRGQVYVVTAAHVVRGNQHPSVYLFNQPHDPVEAEVLDREEDDVKGLAMLRLKVRSGGAGVVALKLGPTTQLDGGEDVKVIGFPDGTAFWTVGTGSIARIEGRNLVFSGSVRSGNSGGPVILNGQVIGLVTDVSQSSAYATRGEVVELYINGIVPDSVSTGTTGTTRPDHSESPDEFCRVINTALEASKKDFASFVGEASVSENTFKSTVMLPGATSGWVRPPKGVTYGLDADEDKGKVESLFYNYVTKVRGCYPNWEEKENSDSTYRYHKFRKTWCGSY
jgi:hypothetical protein